MATEMTAIQKAKWFVVLKLFNETFDSSYLKSVTATDTPTPKQMDGLARCVTGLRLDEKLDKYNLHGFIPFYDTELDWSDMTNDEASCFKCGERLDVECDVVFDETEKRFWSVEEFKKHSRIRVPVVKKSAKMLMSGL